MIRGEFSLIDKGFDLEKCKLAAEKGNPEAQESLAYCYYYGMHGIGKDENKVFQWAYKSAKQELPEGLDLLGDCYRRGLGVEVNEKKAFEYYEKSAEYGCPNGIGDLGECYLKGIGVEQNTNKGIALLEEAADRDFDPAIKNLADYYLDLDENEKAFKLYKKAAKLDNIDAEIMLGLCYLAGIGTEKDEHKAFKLLHKNAVECDNGEALHWLGWFYETGTVVEQDLETANIYYEKALKNGYVEPKPEIKTLEDYYTEDDDYVIEFPKKGAINYKADKEKIQSCIVFIENHHGDRRGEGSGYIISPDGYIATCEHVIRDAEKIFIKITGQNNKKKVFMGTVIKANAETDTAIIKIENAPELPFVELDDREESETEEDVIIYGYPLGSNLNDDVFNLNISFAKGNVSSNQVIDGIKKTMLDISAKHGNSGSPIISCKTGKVVGALKGIVPGQDAWEEVNYMMPVCYLHDLIKEIEEEKKTKAKESESPKEEPRTDTRTNMTWAEVKRILRKEYKVADENNDCLRFVFDLENNRSQSVFAELAQNENGEQWVKISSCVGLIDNSEINEVLKRLGECCFGGLVLEYDKHYISHSLLLDTVSESNLLRSIIEIAQLADEIEEKYIGGDQY